MNPDPGPSENEIVRVIRALVARPAARGIRRGIGDDAAVVEPTPGTVLVATTDLLLEDIHFRRRWAEPADIGWKAMAVNVSDVAAMGGTPRWALVALAGSPGTRPEEIEAFYEGALALCDAHDVVIIGGDTAASAGGWVVNVTLLGEAIAPLLRSTARPGDVVAVTGTLGRAAAGLAVLERDVAPAGVPAAVRDDVTGAQLRPRPRVTEAQWLVAAGGVTAMMDLSDGLATDLPRLAAESACGALLHVDRVPIAASTRAVALALGVDASALATGGGEDYELLLTCDATAFDRLDAGLRAATGIPLTAVGKMTATTDVRWVDVDGRDVAVAAGFEHFSRA